MTSAAHPFVAGPKGWVTTGFTLIELMITVAIVAILAAVAYPAYTSSVIKGKRAEGRTALTDLMLQQERFMTQTGIYAAFAVGATGVAFKTTSGDSGSPAYDLTAGVCADLSPVPTLRECVQLRAVPRFVDPDVNVLRFVSTGQKDCNGTVPARCWK